MPTIDRFLPSHDASKANASRLRDMPSQIKGVSSLRPQTKANREAVRKINPRRLLGLLLIAISLAGGYFTVMKADQRISVVALSRDISAGQVIQEADLMQIKAAVPGKLYAQTKREVVGQALISSASSGELLPLSRLATGQRNALVAIAIKSINLPSVARGDRVALWAAGQLVATDLIVDAVEQESSHRVLTLEIPDEVLSSVIASLSTDLTVVKMP